MADKRPVAPAAAQKRRLAEIDRLLAAGKLAQAAELCDAELLLNPRDVATLHRGGIVALRQGDAARAIDRLRRAALMQPRDVAVLTDFGRALDLAGKPAEADTAFHAAITLQPDAIEPRMALADLFGRYGRESEAAAAYEGVIGLRADLAEAHARLARMRLRLRMPRDALEAANRALALRPDLVMAVEAQGSALDLLGRVEEALVARRKQIRLRPQSGGARYDLGMTQMHHGQLPEAIASFREAIALEPGRGAWHRALAFVVKHKSRDADIEAMLKLNAGPKATADDRMHLGFGLGKSLEELEAFDESFDHFIEGNRLKRATIPYSPAETDRLFDTVKAALVPERFAAHAQGGNPDPTPIFVLGMPRSGTSLIEQVLASHPDVQGGGEFRVVNQLIGTIAGGEGFPLAAALDAITDDKLREMGEHYVMRVREMSSSSRFVTDKLPGNFIMIGMIKLMLPNAKIIHVTRDPIDNSLSLFKNFFAGEHLRFAYDLREIGHYHRRYVDLMAHWHKVLPGFVHDVSYETLVADFDTEAKKLVAYCDLDWREECREFFKARYSVQTASAVQVRQPIYTSSIGQADRYGDRLKPLLEALAG